MASTIIRSLVSLYGKKVAKSSLLQLLEATHRSSQCVGGFADPLDAATQVRACCMYRGVCVYLALCGTSCRSKVMHGVACMHAGGGGEGAQAALLGCCNWSALGTSLVGAVLSRVAPWLLCFVSGPMWRQYQACMHRVPSRCTWQNINSGRNSELTSTEHHKRASSLPLGGWCTEFPTRCSLFRVSR